MSSNCNEQVNHIQLAIQPSFDNQLKQTKDKDALITY